MKGKRDRTLVIIGGHEDRTGEKLILGEVARRTGAGKLVVSTVATEQPDELFAEYEQAFRGLGVKHVYRLDVASREEARQDAKVRILDGATTVFFTGGDQLRITSQFGDSPTYQRILEIYEVGGTVAGTSAGAAIMCETMLVSGKGEESHRVGDLLQLAPGLGLVSGVIIDQHFAERGRLGRLLGAVCLNPKNLGVGIDENTAVVVEGESRFYVLGAGAVYVVDGADVSYSNIAQEEEDHTLSAHGVRLHVLSQGDCFDIKERLPTKLTGKAAELLPEPAAAGVE